MDDTIYPYTRPAVTRDAQGNPVLDEQGNQKPVLNEKGEPTTEPDPQWWVRLQPVKTYEMQLRAQRDARYTRDGKFEIDEVKATYIVWAQMIIDGVVPDAHTGEALVLVDPETKKPRWDRYPRLSWHVGSSIDLAISERDGTNPGAWSVRIQGKETDFRSSD